MDIMNKTYIKKKKQKIHIIHFTAPPTKEEEKEIEHVHDNAK